MNPLTLIPTNWLWPAAGIAGAALVAAFGVQTIRVDRAQLELAKVNAAWSADKAQAAERSRQAEADARAEEQRRFAAQKEIADDAARKIQKARADAVVAAAAADRLQQRVAALVAESRQAACDSAPISPSAPAADAAGVLAELQRRADERAGILARIADERGAAGATCERDYDALTPHGLPTAVVDP